MEFILIWTQRNGAVQSVSVRLNNMNKKVEDRVYFIHGKSNVKSADFLIKGIRSINSEEEAEKIARIDYYMPECDYVQEFLKEHPEYVYIGGTDNMHVGGWGMSFKGYKKIECPSLDVIDKTSSVRRRC